MRIGEGDHSCFYRLCQLYLANHFAAIRGILQGEHAQLAYCKNYIDVKVLVNVGLEAVIYKHKATIMWKKHSTVRKFNTYQMASN